MEKWADLRHPGLEGHLVQVQTCKDAGMQANFAEVPTAQLYFIIILVMGMQLNELEVGPPASLLLQQICVPKIPSSPG